MQKEALTGTVSQVMPCKELGVEGWSSLRAGVVPERSGSLRLWR